MKALVIFLLLVTAACPAQDTNGITRKVHNGTTGKFRAESFFRDGQRVMVEYSSPNKQGIWSVTSRAYFAGGKTVAIENDEDRDGFFESLIVYRSDTDDIEAFTRQRDGSVQPVSARVLHALKSQDAAFSEFGKAISKEADPEKLEKAIRDVQKKVRDAEKEKTNGKE